jgi:tetratricopeptide (TPR) repeat protein
MSVDDYIGKVTKPATTAPAPPPEVAAAFRDALDRALAIARKRIEQNPRDADAHYQLGSAVGLRASYTATVDASAMGALRSAREAYDEEERALALDPHRKDAGLIVGTYRYIVATLSLPFRWAAYVVGFGGDKDRGLKMIEDAAAYRGDNEEDARFALILLYNREKRFDDALRELRVLQERYPRNRLVWLELGSTNLRAGHLAEAVRVLEEGTARFADDRRPNVGRSALWATQHGPRVGGPHRGRGVGPQTRAHARRAKVGVWPHAPGARTDPAEVRKGRRSEAGISVGHHALRKR